MAQSAFDAVFSTHEASQFLGLARQTLAKMRVQGRGPHYVKLSRAKVGYRHSALVAWLAERERTSTSDSGPAPNPGHRLEGSSTKD
jgi:predicted DNA-binding transcriptional regulator AlpA